MVGPRRPADEREGARGRSLPKWNGCIGAPSCYRASGSLRASSSAAALAVVRSAQWDNLASMANLTDNAIPEYASGEGLATRQGNAAMLKAS